MYVYFNNQGILTTSIPHGRPVRQGSYLDIYVCLEPSFPIDEYQVTVELAFPDGGAKGTDTLGCVKALTAEETPIEPVEFKKIDDSEATYDLKDGQRYWILHFRFPPNQSTIYAGKLIASISIVKVASTLNDEGVATDVIEEDVNYYGNVDIYVEKTTGNAKRSVDDNSSDYYNGLKNQIIEIDKRKVNKGEYNIEISNRVKKNNSNQEITTEVNNNGDEFFVYSYNNANESRILVDPLNGVRLEYNLNSLTVNDSGTKIIGDLFVNDKNIFTYMEEYAQNAVDNADYVKKMTNSDEGSHPKTSTILNTPDIIEIKTYSSNHGDYDADYKSVINMTDSEITMSNSNGVNSPDSQALLKIAGGQVEIQCNSEPVDEGENYSTSITFGASGAKINNNIIVDASMAITDYELDEILT